MKHKVLKKIEEAKQVFRKMLVDEYSIKSADQFFSTEEAKFR